MKRTWKLTVALIVVAMLCVMLPVVASAATVASGHCGADGDNLTWVLDSNGTLTISGKGAMSGSPWYTNRDQIRSIKILDGVTSISVAAFEDCSKLTSVAIPSSVTSIGERAFMNCKSLTNVSIPSALKTLEPHVFYGCSGLSSVKIPDGVTSIGSYAFGYCTRLSSVTIPSSVTSIGMWSFYGCTSLKNLTIPSSVTTIFRWAIGYTLNLSTLREELISGLTITGVSGSEAETYAKDNNIRFIAIAGNLATPQITSVKASGTSVTVTWGKVSGAAKYRLFYKKDGKWTKLKDTTGTSATITGGVPGKTYTYTVRCISSDGKVFTSDYDKTGKSVTLNLLTTPKITSVTADGTKVTVTWGKVTGAEKYRLFYKKDGKWTTLRDTASTSVTLNGTTGKTYTYTVRCINSAGTAYTSAYDATGKSITLGKLATPKISSVTGEAGGVTIKWGAISGAAKYRVFYKGDSGWKKIADTTSTSYKWTATEAGKTYSFTVRCVSADGATFTSDYDTKGTSYTVPSGKLATPKLSSVTYDATGVTLKWGAVSGAAKYRVFYKTGSNGWKKIADTASTSYVWKSATNGTKYTFTVRCVSSDGATFTSDYDTTGKTITYTTTLGTPKISGVSGSAGSVTIKWGAVAGAAKYRVFYKGDTGWKKIADTTSTSYTWTGAKAGSYTFTVRCVTSDGATFTSSYDTKGVSFTAK